MDNITEIMSGLSMPLRMAAFTGFAIAIHAVVILIRQTVVYALSRAPRRRYQKLRSIGTLLTSVTVFTLYFLAIGLILREFGVSLTAYLASASVIGLAIGFGSQGVVQDVVTGLTFIFSDLVDVGDLVEVSGQKGIVKAITMRFVELENALGARVFIPNRTIANVINYPRGYLRCIVDITLTGDEARQDDIERTADRLMGTVQAQFPGIFVYPPSNEGRMVFGESKKVLRLKFRIWPDRQQPIETAFYEQLVAEITQQDPDYKRWMVTISFEVEAQKEQRVDAWLWRKKK
ncbi:MAG: mechanosensitive ion channel family protein [Gammaproteobacteria bacterium]|nr:mechanosensitive ion channel family protein [Gammaproteobacteria bacterium]